MFLQLLVICLCFGLSDLQSVGSTGCRDVNDNCRFYQPEICTAPEFKPWTQDHCALFCGLCHLDVTTPRDCTDKVNCSTFDSDGSLCHTPDYKFWIQDHCRAHCHVLGC